MNNINRPQYCDSKMNYYDDSDSSANSFRARSNTWPLNRPDLALPTGVCIDETLPELELEEDDLFTTNENWSTGLVDHDIMSWDPILTAQNHHHQQQQQAAAVHQSQHQHQHQPHQQPHECLLGTSISQLQPHQQTHETLLSGSTILTTACNVCEGLDTSQMVITEAPQFQDQDSGPQEEQQQQQPQPQQQQQQQQPHTQQHGDTSSAKQSNSTSKTKLNTPRRNAWGNMSYADLISQAINSTDDKRLTLSQIYDWMVQHVPYFKDKGDSNSSAGWKNSVRHNLSLHNRFKRLQNEGAGKSSWWTINPEANVGKCARRRAASMEASKYEKKRGRAKKRADAIRQGLVSYPSLTNSSLNGSNGNLEQSQPQPSYQFDPQQQTAQPQLCDSHLLDQQPDIQQQQQHQQQQQQQEQELHELQPHHQQIHGLSYDNLHRQPDTGLYVVPSQEPQYDQSLRYHQYEFSTPF